MRRGIVLIVVLAVLTLLSLLATGFAMRQGIERRIARNHLEAVQARFAAQSGIEFAIDRLWQLTHTGWFNLPIWKDTGPPILVDGEIRQKTGAVGNAVYSVQVLDCQGQINVNDGADEGLEGRTSQNLRRILNILGREVDVPFLGDRILAHRPPGGYASKYDLQRAVDHDASKFRRFRDHVTVHSWRNARVQHPVGLAERRGHGKDRLNRQIHQPLQFYDPGISETEWRFPWYSAVWSLDSLQPRAIENASRSPVNINSATREVLISLLEGLEGFFLLDRRRPVPFDMFYQFLSHSYGYGPELNRRTTSWARKGSELGYLYRTHPIDATSARRVADEIVANRPFREWQQFHRFADDLVKKGVLVDPRVMFFDYQRLPNGSIARTYSSDQARLAAQAMADVLKANFNPNVHLNELNPDASLALLVDKTDLIVNSTEFCFVPMGTFEIQSEGMILSETRCTARSHHRAVVNLYRPEWHGTGFKSRDPSVLAADGHVQLAPIGGPSGRPAIYASLERPVRGADTSHNFAEQKYRIDGLYAELHSVIGLTVPEFQRRATFSFWIKPSWDPRFTGKIRSFLSLDDMTTTGKRDPRGPLPFGLYFLPSWHGPSEPVVKNQSAAPRSSLLWAVGIKGRGGHAVSVPAKLEGHRWTHVVVSCEAGGNLTLCINGERQTTNVMVHSPQLPRDWRGHYGPVVRLGGEFSDLGLNPDYPRIYYADATLDEFQAWFDDPRSEEEALRQFEMGRFQKRGEYRCSISEEKAIALSWTGYEIPRIRIKVNLGDDPGWSPISDDTPGEFVARFEDAERGPLLETAVLDDWTVFYSQARSKVVSYCAVDVP